jgi:hypothetical protein
MSLALVLTRRRIICTYRWMTYDLDQLGELRDGGTCSCCGAEALGTNGYVFEDPVRHPFAIYMARFTPSGRWFSRLAQATGPNTASPAHELVRLPECGGPQIVSSSNTQNPRMESCSIPIW